MGDIQNLTNSNKYKERILKSKIVMEALIFQR